MSLGVQAAEYLAEVLVDQPVALAANLVKAGSGYHVGLVDAVRNVTVSSASPCHTWTGHSISRRSKPHGRGSRQMSAPRLAPLSMTPVARYQRASRPELGRSITRASQAGTWRSIHASTLRSRRPCRSAAWKSGLISRGATTSMRFAIRFARMVPSAETLPSGGAGPLTFAQAENPVPEVPSATGGVGTSARPADDPELFEIQVIGEFADVGRGPFICATRIEGAVALNRSIECDESHAFVGGSAGVGSEVGMRTRRAMKSDDRRAIACAELAPSEVTTVRRLEHSEISHRADCPRCARAATGG